MAMFYGRSEDKRCGAFYCKIIVKQNFFLSLLKYITYLSRSTFIHARSHRLHIGYKGEQYNTSTLLGSTGYVKKSTETTLSPSTTMFFCLQLK